MEILITKRLTLRPPLEVDAEQITLALNKKDVAKNLSGMPYPYEISDAHEWIKSSRRHPFVYTIHRERLVGVVRIKEGDEAPKLGFWLDKPFWGHGYMNEAIQVVLNKAFGDGVQKIASIVFEDNEPAIKILKKNGFVVTGEGKNFCAARGEPVPTTKTILRRADFKQINADRRTSQAA